MDDTTVWLIALAFYAPLHYLGPGLAALFTGADTPVQRQRLLVRLAADCTLTMIVAFAVAIGLFRAHPGPAMAILLLSMLAPYVHLAIVRWRGINTS